MSGLTDVIRLTRGPIPVAPMPTDLGGVLWRFEEEEEAGHPDEHALKLPKHLQQFFSGKVADAMLDCGNGSPDLVGVETFGVLQEGNQFSKLSSVHP